MPPDLDSTQFSFCPFFGHLYVCVCVWRWGVFYSNSAISKMWNTIGWTFHQEHFGKLEDVKLLLWLRRVSADCSNHKLKRSKQVCKHLCLGPLPPLPLAPFGRNTKINIYNNSLCHRRADGSVCFVHLFFSLFSRQISLSWNETPFMWRFFPNLIQSWWHPTSATRPLCQRLSDQLRGFLQDREWTGNQARTCVSSQPSRNNTACSVQLVRPMFLLAADDCLRRHEPWTRDRHVASFPPSKYKSPLARLPLSWRHLWTLCGRLWRPATPLLIPATSCRDDNEVANWIM